MSTITRRLTTIVRTFVYSLRSLFLTGLITLLPIALTAGLAIVSLRAVKSWLAPLYNLEPDYLKRFPHSEIIFALIVILILGVILRFVVVASLIRWAESGLSRVPLVRQIYFGIKQLVHAFTSQDTASFQTVILIEFPRKGIYSLGFATRKLPRELSPTEAEHFLSIFIPTTPNPTTGYYIIAQAADCKIVDLTRQEAMAIIISGGIIQPERFEKQHNFQ